MDEKQSPLEGMMSEQEMTNMTAALKDPEFRKLLAEYCNEMADPKNQALYEQELTQYEAERGIDLTFITPKPGFVIKTIVDGREKAFINVSRNDKVDRPTSHYASDATGRRGLQWSIPLTQAPPRQDVDNKKQKCTAYDVVFHPDTLHLAARNREFRQLVINTACDAVESAFQVRLDRANLRFPKMTFKGTPRPTVIRKKLPAKHKNNNNKSTNKINRSSSSESECQEDVSITDQFYPKVDMANLNGDRAPTVIESRKKKDTPEFTVPTYKLVHRRGVDMQEMTHERDAKLNTTIPLELVVTVDLPLLTTSKHVKLDVRERQFQLTSETEARYKLDLTLPYSVLEDSGSAQFDSGKRQLTVTLPVDRQAVDLKLSDLSHRPALLAKQPSDSGVDSPSSSHSHSSSSDDDTAEVSEDLFLDSNTAYTLPTFATNVLDNDVVFTLNVKNVDPESVKVVVEEESASSSGLRVKFFSVGSGFVPSHFAFHVKFTGRIISHSAEAWDNNVVLQVELSAVPGEFHYGVGGKGDEDLMQGHLRSTNISYNNNNDKTEVGSGEKQAFAVQVREETKQEMTIELSKQGDQEDEEEDVFQNANEKPTQIEKTTTTGTSKTGKKEKGQKQTPAVSSKKDKKKRKGRSLSESDLKPHQEEEVQTEEVLKGKQSHKEGNKENHTQSRNGTTNTSADGARKARSVSESSGDILDANGNLFHFKGILKRRSLHRSVSESCSSMDEAQMAVSFDTGVGSFGDIPEEEDSEHEVGSEKKQVTFNDVIRKQLFRADSSIVGRKLKNLKKRAKKRADGRRFSESENSEGEDKHLEVSTGDEEGVVGRRDSGVDFSDGHEEESAEGGRQKKGKGRNKGKGQELEFKSGMIFNLEM